MENGKIYKITNTETNSLYIGCTINSIRHRFEEHCYRCLKTKINTKLCNSIRKYGVEKFTIEIIDECSLEIIYDREVELIKEYNSFDNGLNSTLGGEGCLGYKHSPEIRVKISEAIKNGKSHKGKTYDEIYGERVEEEKIKRKEKVKNYWDNISEEEKQQRLLNLKNAVRKNTKYSIETIQSIKKLISENVKPSEIHKQYPEVNIDTIYCIKQGRRWKD
jgi:group I intron endonuclease